MFYQIWGHMVWTINWKEEISSPPDYHQTAGKGPTWTQTCSEGLLGIPNLEGSAHNDFSYHVPKIRQRLVDLESGGILCKKCSEMVLVCNPRSCWGKLPSWIRMFSRCGWHQELSTDSIQSELELKCPFKEIQRRPVAQMAAAHFWLIPAQTVSTSQCSA